MAQRFVFSVAGGTVPPSSVSGSTKVTNRYDAYVSDLLMTGLVQQAAFYDLSGHQLSISDDFGLTDEEVAAILEGFRLPLALHRSDVTVAGRLYRIHVTDGRYGIMAKEGLPSRGCTICRTNTLLIVAVHDERTKPTSCNEVVMNMGDFFRRKGL